MFYQLNPFGSDWLKPSDSRCVCDQNDAFCCFSVKNKKSKTRFLLELVSDQTNVRLNPPLIRPFPSWCDLWSYDPQTEVISDHTIPRPKWPLVIPSPDRTDLWSYHPQTEVTSDHTILRSNRISDPVILVWEHTVCDGLGLIRGHFRMARQLGCS